MGYHERATTMLLFTAETATVWLLVLCVYFVPTLIAVDRKVPNTGSVIVINVLLGWTLIGWVVALAMAARSVPPRLTR